MEEEIKIIETLKRVGIIVNDLYDLVNTSKSYTEAIPILIKFLKNGVKNDDTKEAIIRALAIPEAKGKVGSLLIDEYNQISKDKRLLRWAIGNTMTVTITDIDVDGVIKIIKDKSNGMSREMFVLSLGQIKAPKCEDALIEALDDDEIAAHALEAVRKLKVKKAKNKVLELTNHSNRRINKEALKTLKKIL